MQARRYGAGGYGGASQGPYGSLFAGIMAGWDGVSQIFNDVKVMRDAQKIRDQAEKQEAAEKKQAAGAGTPGLAEALLATPDEYGSASVSRTSTDPYYGLGIGKGPITMEPVKTPDTSKPITPKTGAPGEPTDIKPADTATPTTTAAPAPTPTTMPASVAGFTPGGRTDQLGKQAAAAPGADGYGGGGDDYEAPPSPAGQALPTTPEPRLAVSGAGGGPGDHTKPVPVKETKTETEYALPTFGTQAAQLTAPQRPALGTQATGATGVGTTLGETSYAVPSSTGRLGGSLLYGPGGRRAGASTEYTLATPEDEQQAIATGATRRQQQQAAQQPRYAQTPTQAAAPVLIPQFDVFGNPILQPTNPQVRRG